MSNRFYEYDVKGSSRSGRDDSRRAHERDRDRHGEGRRLVKSRSRSPRRHSPGPRESRYNTDKDDKDRRVKSYDIEDSDPEEVPAPPPPPRISKISIGFTKPKVAPIKMSLGSTSKAHVVPKPTVASVFDDDDDDEEPEEMPAEARMRMRNIGRETPTSAGPNSFGKTKQGFCDAKKVFEKNLKQALETDDKPRLPKFPQTIYKIKGP